ncbi:hypothetical protein [Streptococcus gallinaceus]|uniref:CHASE2 domain-containing sensor protein n=1 Tax=Streptococcus gallinaceus TaxID=165758 RepID=A0ABV2JI59_9STRE|nr:hypothetical protein [Streptococcus gallinaceus]MCP1638463.1 CHASE2 domain-containing sensor protein [Streptococcus gallinaceus]MCP1769450.1 CHASE2 domain-containing sensor protein [Streptococcus gallinaceus]
MTTQLLIIFLWGAALCLAAYFLRQYKTWRNALAILGSFLMIAPLALILYFLLIIFA